MKSFAFYIIPKRRDAAGNPQDLISVYRVRGNDIEPVARGIPIGYRTPQQAAVDIAVTNGALAAHHKGRSAAGLENGGIARFTDIT